MYGGGGGPVNNQNMNFNQGMPPQNNNLMFDMMGGPIMQPPMGPPMGGPGPYLGGPPPMGFIQPPPGPQFYMGGPPGPGPMGYPPQGPQFGMPPPMGPMGPMGGQDLLGNQFGNMNLGGMPPQPYGMVPQPQPGKVVMNDPAQQAKPVDDREKAFDFLNM